MKLESPLDRQFRAIVFPWEDLAVDQRSIMDARSVLERLLRCGVHLVVETRGNVRDPGLGLGPALDGPHRARFLVADRTGGVFAVDRHDGGLECRRIAGDVLAWLRHEFAPAHRMPLSEVLIIGAPGTGDGRLEVNGPVRVDWGDGSPAPEGSLVYLPGGRAQLLKLLKALAALHPVAIPVSPGADAGWLLVEEGPGGSREHEIESLFATSNGLLGTRDSLLEGGRLSAPATFVAGVFECPPAAGSVPQLVNLPNWTELRVSIDGHAIRLDSGENLQHRRLLDLRRGISWREWRHRDPQGRITMVREYRLASQTDRHLLLQSIAITPENYGGQVRLEGRLLRSMVQRGSSIEVGMAIECLAECPDSSGMLRHLGARAVNGMDDFEFEVQPGKTYRFDRLVAVETSRHTASPLEAARGRLTRTLTAHDIDELVEAHARRWRQLWDTADVSIEATDPMPQKGVRFAIHHLLSAAYPEDERVSIGARALTGGVYKGHVFWDTEIFMLPFYVLNYPEAARALLMYRFHTLPAARTRALAEGYRGCLFPWESADTGEDVTPTSVTGPDGQVIPIWVAKREQHISADVAFGVWSYWQACQDVPFLLTAGAEILLETARFWASRAQLEADGMYHIRNVIGPDEYHELVDDNAYTNVMAQWNLERAAEAAELISRQWPDTWARLASRLRLESDELAQWRRVASSMYTGFDPETGLFEQFQGYFGLEKIDLRAYEPRSAAMDMVLGRERTQTTQVIKQADVLLLIYLLWDRFSPEVRRANFEYYEPRTDHGSSLSPPIHALLAARLGELALAERYFRRTIAIDLSNGMGNAAGGVHAGALGGLWQAAVFGFAGLDLTGERPTLHPALPKGWEAIGLSVNWRGQTLALRGRRPSSRVAAEERTEP